MHRWIFQKIRNFSNRRYIIVRWWERYYFHLAVIAILWGVVMTNDYKDQLAAAREKNDNLSRQMAACLNGTWRGRTESGELIACWPAETWKGVK